MDSQRAQQNAQFDSVEDVDPPAEPAAGVSSGASGSTAGTPHLSEKALRIIPWVMATAMFMENLDATIVNTAVPTIARDLVVQPLALKAVLTSYTLALAVFIPISGWMADRFGTKRVFHSAIGVFALGSLLCGLSVNTHMLVVSRIVQGFGGAMMTPVARLVLVRAYPRSDYLRVLNYVLIPVMIAPLVGPSVGGLIVHFFPWRVIFFINLPISVAGIWAARKFMADFREAVVPKLDWAGFVLFGAGVAAVSYVLEIFGEHSGFISRTDASGEPVAGVAVWVIWAFAAAGVGLLTAYVLHAQRAAHPVLQLGLFRTRTFNVSVTGGFITRLGVGGMPFLLPLLYQVGMGFAPWKAGLLTVPQACAATGMRVISRKILARYGHRRVLALNTIFLGCNIMVFSRIGPGTPIVAILGLSLMQGFFSSLQFSSINSITYADIDNRDASKASSIASTVQQMALSFGVASAALVAGFFLSGIPQTQSPAFISGIHKTFLVLGAFTILSSLIFRSLKEGDGANVSHYAPRAARGA